MINENTYAEVYEILSYMDKMTVMKVPVDLLKFIKDNKNENYKSLIDKNDIFNMKNISDDARHILAWLDINYWMSEEKKEHLKEKYYKEHISFYDSENIFKNENNKKMQQPPNNTEVMEYKGSILVKIINKLKKIFRQK